MTQEEKDLLYKDLSERILYDVKADGYPWIHSEYVDGITKYEVKLQGTWVNIEKVKPYLRSIDSISNEESNEMEYLLNRHNIEGFLDFVYSRHIDWRNLIEKNLAIKAHSNMYNLKPI